MTTNQELEMMTPGPKTSTRSDWSSRKSWIDLPPKHKLYFQSNLTERESREVCSQWTVSGMTPKAWAMKAIALWHRLQADALVAEVNQGGDMVGAVINEVDASVPVTNVRALRAKWLRAEPVATLYEQGRVKHAGIFAGLEDEMCDFGSAGLSSGKSPDRLDALVWAIVSLALQPRGGPRIRML